MLRIGKTPGIDITVKMLKYGEVILDWILWICNLAWEQHKASGDWGKAITMPVQINLTAIGE